MSARRHECPCPIPASLTEILSFQITEPNSPALPTRRSHLPPRRRGVPFLPRTSHPTLYSAHLSFLYSRIFNMRFSTALFAILPALALASDVVDLTSSSFSSEVMGEDLALVE